MSMKWYGYTTTALVLNEKELKTLIEKYSKVFHKNIRLEDINLYDFEFKNTHSLYSKSGEGLNNTFYINELSEYETDTIIITPFKKPNGEWNIENQISYNKSHVYLIECNYPLNTPQMWIQNMYPTYEDLVQEFKNKCEYYLEPDFDWDSHIASVNYAIFC